jgi:hypothetical protein
MKAILCGKEIFSRHSIRKKFTITAPCRTLWAQPCDPPSLTSTWATSRLALAKSAVALFMESWYSQPPCKPLLYPSEQFSFLTANLSDLRIAALLLSKPVHEFDKFKSRLSLRKLTGARSIF